MSSQLTGRAGRRSVATTAYAQQIEARQQSLMSELRSRNIPVTGRVATLANVVFVSAPKSRAAELKSLAGVKGVVPVRIYKRKLNRATQLVNLPGAWNLSGGPDNAGKGVKIGFLDTGIDQKHAAFQDSSLPPAGYPICSGADCAYTSNKVIVARSYVRQIAAGTGDDPAADSRPDDYSPRDRVGHGTAVASVAAGVANGGTVTASGMAPKAYVGNYKIYGSPYINDVTTDEAIILALDDAFNDGMDIVSFSTGGPAFSGPLDTGAACGNDPGEPCDLLAQVFEKAVNAVPKGMIIVAATGNEADTGANYPAFGTIDSPASAPSVIAVGATTNSHQFIPIVTVPGSDAPSSLKAIATEIGNAYLPSGAVSLPLRDVTSTGDDGLACAAMPEHSLDGTFALIQRGTCTFPVKLSNAWNAGAMGAIFYMADDAAIFGPGGLASFSVPAAMISLADGLALKEFIATNPNHLLTLNPGGIEQDASGNQLTYFSSLGPATGTSAIKPDLVATGANMYMATQNYDALSDMYGADGYVVANGTSFSTPMVSGAAAILKQLHPSFTPAQIRSALVNTTTHDVSEDEKGNPLDIRSLGAGKLDAGAAAAAVVTCNPSSISFGALASAALPVVKTIEVTNSGSSAVTLTAAAVAEKASSTAQLTLAPQTLSLEPGATATLTVTLAGTLPAAGGSFSGNVTLTGSGLSLKVPYLFLVGSGVAANMIPLTNGSFEGITGGPIVGGIISFRLVDAYGVPVSGAGVTFTPYGGVTLQDPSSTTDAYGIAYAVPILPSVATTNCSIVAVAGLMRMTFSGSAVAQPTISNSGGVVNGASFDASVPIAPGSYISIFGTALSDTTNYPTTPTLPMVLDYVMVSFDVPSAGISVPGRITYISPTQVNLQVPWELQGQSEARVKVILNYDNGNVVTVPLADYSPAFFEVGSGAVAALDINYKLVSNTNAQSAGQVVMLYANGLGPVTNQPASGEPAPYNPLAETKTRPVVTIGGQKADVSFSGLAPGFAGLYQINATIPSGLTAGNQPITVSIGGKTSKTSNIAVQ